MNEFGSSRPKLKIRDLFGIKWPDEPIKTLNWVISCTLITSNLCTHKNGIMILDNHKLTTVKYKSVFLTRNGKKQFLTVDEGIRRLTVKPIGNLK